MSTVSTSAPPSGRSILRRFGAACAAAALATTSLVGIATSAHAGDVTETFRSASGTTWTVPPGVTSLEVEVVGASGGGGDILEIPIIGLPLSGDGAGGGAHLVRATLEVTPGEQIQLYGSTVGEPVGSRHEPGAGGTGYRDGGAGDTGSLAGRAGGGGGGASALVAGDRLIVAAGGGGGAGRGAGFAGCYGGHGGNGGSSGVNGHGICGGAGSGGNAGVISSGTGGQRDDAGDSSSGGGGGGGGGGYRGGEGGGGSKVGGAGGGGGGGGSSHVSTGISTSGPSERTTRGSGYVRITYDPTFTTTVDLIADPQEPVYGQPVGFTATVANDDTGDVPTGQVHLYQGDQLLGAAALVDARAVFNAITLDVGTDEVRAEYVPASEDFYPSTGATGVTVNPGATTTTLQLQPQDVVIGQDLTATAHVGPVSPASGTVEGAVEFTSDGESLGTAEVRDGVASFDLTAGPVGSQDIGAVYLGTDRFLTSTAVTRSVQVDRGQTETEVISAPNPSVRGQEVDLRAQVLVSAPADAARAGTIQFHVDGEPVGDPQPVSEDGTAELTTSDLTVGAHQVSAGYSGGNDLHPSTSAEHLHAVERAAAQVDLQPSPDASRYGQEIELSAAVSVLEPGVATVSGSVEFFAGEVSLGTSQVTTSAPEEEAVLPYSELVALQETRTEGVATLQVGDLAVGEHELTAVYSGNDEVHPATAAAAQVVVEAAEVEVVVTSEPAPSVFGQLVQIDAVVAPVHDSVLIPDGEVVFEIDGERMAGAVSLIDGTAVLEADDLTVGDREVVAHYLGDEGHDEAASSAHRHQVAPGATSTALSLAAAEVATDQPVLLMADVSVLDPARGTPAGTVQFFLDGEPVEEPVELNSTAALEVTGLEPGTYTAQAQYSGSQDFTESSSAEVTVTVAPEAADPGEVGAGSGSGGADGGTLPRAGLTGALVGLAALLAVTGAGMLAIRRTC